MSPRRHPSQQARGEAVAADPSGKQAQRAAAYQGLVQQLLTLNVSDGAAVGRLLAAVAAETGEREEEG